MKVFTFIYLPFYGLFAIIIIHDGAKCSCHNRAVRGISLDMRGSGTVADRLHSVERINTFFSRIFRTGNPMEAIMRKSAFFTSKNIAYLAVLLALVIVLQLVGTMIGNLGVTAPSLVLIPIVLGAVLLGPLAGGILGFAFGVVVVLAGVFGMDKFTLILFTDHPFLTVLLCLLKGTAAGVASGYIFKTLRNRNQNAAVVTASLAAPVVNTGLFILGALLMSDTLNANFVADGQTVLYFLIVVCAGLNFIFEFIINAVASPAIYTVVRVVKRSVRKDAEPRDEARPGVKKAEKATEK